MSQKVNFYVHIVWFKHSWSLSSNNVTVHFNIIHLPMPGSIVFVPLTLAAWILRACFHPDVCFMSRTVCSPRLGRPSLNEKGLAIIKLLTVRFLSSCYFVLQANINLSLLFPNIGLLRLGHRRIFEQTAANFIHL